MTRNIETTKVVAQVLGFSLAYLGAIAGLMYQIARSAGYVA